MSPWLAITMINELDHKQTCLDLSSSSFSFSFIYFSFIPSRGTDLQVILGGEEEIGGLEVPATRARQRSRLRSRIRLKQDEIIVTACSNVNSSQAGQFRHKWDEMISSSQNHWAGGSRDARGQYPLAYSYAARKCSALRRESRLTSATVTSRHAHDSVFASKQMGGKGLGLSEYVMIRC
jgi:hypothetical protein